MPYFGMKDFYINILLPSILRFDAKTIQKIDLKPSHSYDLLISFLVRVRYDSQNYTRSLL